MLVTHDPVLASYANRRIVLRDGLLISDESIYPAAIHNRLLLWRGGETMAALTYRSAAKIAVERCTPAWEVLLRHPFCRYRRGCVDWCWWFLLLVSGYSLNRARSIMAADLSARMFMQPTPEQQKGLDAIEREGVEVTPVTELLSMASSAKTLDPLLVSLKAVDPTMYPFYGDVELAPKVPLKSVLTADSVAVADDLLVRLHLSVGDQLNIGNRLFRIAAVVVNEPDRLSGNFASRSRPRVCAC